MSSDRELTRIVRSWLEEGVNVLPDRVLDGVLAQLPVTSQRSPWWRAWRKNVMNSTYRLAAAGVAVLVVVVVAGAFYINRPIGPAGTATPVQSPEPTSSAVASPTTQPTQLVDIAPWVVFLRGDGRTGLGTLDDLWAMRIDGSDAHEILSGVEFPGVAWSQDGERLLVTDSDVFGKTRVYIAEVSDVIGPLVDIGFGTGADTACNAKSGQPLPCQDFSMSFAPDGLRIVLLRGCTHSFPGCDFLSILDLRTGELTDLTETLRQGNPRGSMGAPAWSPDGSQMAFVREDTPTRGGPAPESHLFLMDANGTNIQEVELGLPRIMSPQWSPDGSTLLLLSDVYSEGGGEPTHTQDLYTVHPDGTSLRQLTDIGPVTEPEWTPSGQIRFRNMDISGDGSEPTFVFSLVDADGGNLRPYADMQPILGALPTSGTSGEYVLGWPGQSFFFQPAEAWQPAE